MSRGLGRVQLAVLGVVRGPSPSAAQWWLPDGGVTLRELAGQVYGATSGQAATEAQYRSVARAVRRLARLGLIRVTRAEDHRQTTVVKCALDAPLKRSGTHSSGRFGVLIESDCREVLARLPDSSADAIFLDPPYNLQLGRGRSRRAAGGRIVRGPVADWDCFESLGEYDALMQPILRQLLQVLRPTGSLWVCGTYHSVHRLGQQLQDMGAWFLSEVIWWIANPAPRPFWSSRPLQTHQTLLWVVRDRKCLHAVERRVDRSLLQEYSRRDLGRKQPVSIWKIGVCQGSERLRRADGSALHPAQKPLELLRRIIAVSTRPGEVVLDPMAGTGTTGVAAAELGRQALLVEANREYVAAARTRLSELTDRP